MNLDPVTRTYVARHPGVCSILPLDRRQKLFYFLFFLFWLLLLAWRWDYFLFFTTALLAFWYFCSAFFRCIATFLAAFGHGIRKVDAQTLATVSDSELPVYTVFVPLYREANISETIIENMKRLDYPKGKLDVKLLLESDDAETIAAVEAHPLPEWFEVIKVPDFQPKTKPRACNFGLERARGEYCVIFDAEDRPDPDQLRKAAIVFRNSPANLACIQAKLNYFNADQNMLTRWFTIEYSTCFDLLLPGLSLLRVPLPLGGTSNHFRTAVLQAIGGWDPFNVTEDCDLGIRIYKQGFRTTVLDSTTWEEANSNLWNWIRQRSRWVKGFFQTHFCHTRRPLHTLRELGLWGFLGFYLNVGASAAMMLVNIVFWAAGGCYLGLALHALFHGVRLRDIIIGPYAHSAYQGILFLGSRIRAWPLVYQGPGEDPFWAGLSVVFFIVSALLFLANGMFVACHCLACVKRRLFHLIPWALLMPVYWLLISIGGWRGFIQFFTKPFYWEKTLHGLDHSKLNGK